MGHARTRIAIVAVLGLATVFGLTRADHRASVTADAAPSPAASAIANSPIQHVVVVIEENRTFDQVLGHLCVDEGNRCEGTTTGKKSTGEVITLVPEPDLRTDVNHGHENQLIGMHGGLMDRFDLVSGCKGKNRPGCLAQMIPGNPNSAQLPNIWRYADTYAIADHTFEPYTSSSWVAHLSIAAGTRDFWHGNNPDPSPFHTPGKGWGCNSFKDAQFDVNQSTIDLRPSCIPDANGQGPYRGPTSPHVSTIFDSLDAAGKSWKIYVANGNGSPWAICPSFASCFNSAQHNNVVKDTQLLPDAANGALPNFSFVIPKGVNSMHPRFSAQQADNWLGSIIDPLMRGPEANSTAVFVFWDDCGCLYDHVNPLQYNSNWGPRSPLLIISPYAKPRYVNTTPTTWVGILAYAEHLFGIAPLAEMDTLAYNDPTGGAWYADAFNYTQTPTQPPALAHTPIPLWERKQIASEPQVEWS